MKTSLGVSLASLVIVQLAGFQSTAIAQDAIVLEEITVTAQRREQSLQEVPISITAFTGDVLQQMNITEAQQYIALTPNVSYTDGFSVGKRGFGIGIRGVNNMVTDENTFVNSVGVYLDEFSVAAVPTGVVNPNLQDIERIEILRGPQGTFFGRNALGGALNLTTEKPTDEFEGFVRAGASSFDGNGESFDLTGMLNGGVTDNLFLRGVAYYEDSDGRVENVNAAGASSESESLMLRGALRWEASDTVMVDLMVMYTDDEQGSDENVPSGVWDIDTVDTFGLNTGAPGSFSSPIDSDAVGFWPNNRSQMSRDRQEFNNNESTIVVATIGWQIGEFDLKWITGVIDTENERLFDNDLVGRADIIFRDNVQEGTSWSTELRMNRQTDAFGIIAGILYADDSLERQNGVTVGTTPGIPLDQFGPNPAGVPVFPPLPPGLVLAGTRKEFDLESLAVFADFTWHATERLDLILGGRFTDDEVTNGLGNPTNANPGGSNTESFSDFAPRAVLKFQVNDGVGIYGSISKGYKAGGTALWNDFATPGCLVDDNAPPTCPLVAKPFAEEELWTYEAGLKSEFWDNRMRLNAAVFFNDWSDLQLESFRFLVPGNLGTNIEEVLSVDDAESTGFEIEWSALLTERFTLSAGLGYTDSEITCACNFVIKGGFDVALQGLTLPRAPETTANAVGEYRWPIGQSEAWLRAEVIYRDEQTTDVEGMTWQQTQGQPTPNGQLPGQGGQVVPANTTGFPYIAPDYTVVNLRGGFLLGENWEFVLYVENAFDEEYYTGTQEDFGLSGFRLRPNPLTYGGWVTLRF